MQKILIMMLISLSLSILEAGDIFPVPKGEYAPRIYTAQKPVSEIIIDGRLDDESWLLTPFSEDFVDIEGEHKPAPHYRTRMKMLWDDNALYIGAELIEEHIWATLSQRDAVIFHDNDFEVFIDPDGDTHDYYELEINAMGTLWDLFLIKPYRDRQQVAVNAWDIRDIEYAIFHDGSLNDPTDIDKAWYVELKLPMHVLAECAHKEVPPRENDYWRINFSRVHWDTKVLDGSYKKIPGRPEYNWVWSPQGLVAMHYPERWGFLFFSHATANEEIVPPNIPIIESAKAYLRQLYYMQKQYYMDKGKYASSLKKLKAKPFRISGRKLPLEIETCSGSYILTLKAFDDIPELHIREDGLIW